MNEQSNQQQAVELLQQLGFKEYEAKCFVALSRLPKGTAKEISETSEVPRTRVYDAIRVLESKGLVEVQHSNPQQFRAVSVEQAVSLLQQEYDFRTSELGTALESVEPVRLETDEEFTHEVWAISGAAAIENRTRELVDDADEEVVLVVGREETFTEELAERLRGADARGVDVVVAAVTDDLRDGLKRVMPDIEVFTSGLEWLQGSDADDDWTAISRLLLVDRNTILVSSVHGPEGRNGEPNTETAVFGRGFDNGIVVVARRLMATGLPRADDPDGA